MCRFKILEEHPPAYNVEPPLDPECPLMKLALIIFNEKEDLPGALALFRHAGLIPHQFFNLVEIVKQASLPLMDDTLANPSVWITQAHSYTELIRGAIWLIRSSKVEESVLGRDWASGDASHFARWITQLLNAMCLHRYLDKVLASVLGLYKKDDATWDDLDTLRNTIAISMVNAILSGRTDVSHVGGAGKI